MINDKGERHSFLNYDIEVMGFKLYNLINKNVKMSKNFIFKEGT